MKRHIQLFMEFVNVFTFVIKMYWSFLALIPNAISIAYAIVKTPHDELATCYLNKLWTFISLHNSLIVSFGKFVLLAFLIMYCRMQTRSEFVHFLLQSNNCCSWMCWKHLCTNLHVFPMTAYVCCTYFNNCNFWIYNICIVVPKCWSFKHPFKSKIYFHLILFIGGLHANI